MSVLFLDFESGERNARVQKLARTGAHILPSEPRWPGFFELAKKEKPYAIAIDFAKAPSHALETADYLAKAKETREAAFYLLQVPHDRIDIVSKRLPQAKIVSDQQLAAELVEAEKQAQERARQKKEAAAQARKNARTRAAAEKTQAASRAAKPAPQKSKKAAGKPERKAAPPKKKPKKPGRGTTHRSGRKR
jgi:hypothetical protein